MGVKISNLPKNALPYSGSELIPMVQNGETRAGSLSSIASLLSGVLLADTELAQLSGVWQSTYTTTQANSARWTNVYNTVSALSASWEESAEILPTVTNYLSSNNVLLSSATFLENIKDSANIIAVDTNNRRLITPTGSILIDWSNTGGYGAEFSNGASLENNALFFADGSSNYYSIQESTLKDASNQVGVNWSSRQLIANDGTTQMLDWSNATAGLAVATGVPLGVDIIYDASTPLTYIDMVNGEIGEYSAYNIPSINWISRQLIGSDGSTVMADWSGATGAALSVDGTLCAQYLTGLDGGLSGFIAFGESGSPCFLLDGAAASVNWTNRQLIASDGTTVALDWSSGIPVTPRITVTPNTVAALTGGEGTIAYVNDADTPAIGSAVVGGASAKCLVCYNGTSWIVTSLL